MRKDELKKNVWRSPQWERAMRTRIESVADGYDPTLGIMHESREASSAFVFDPMEPERPIMDRSILEFVKAQKFHASDFFIRLDGVCRLNPEMARHAARQLTREPAARERVSFLTSPENRTKFKNLPLSLSPLDDLGAAAI
jgi:CRISPR/Cas system-associated endonuclease Cas1